MTATTQMLCLPVINGRQMTPAQLERFWSRVDRSDPSGCWLWTRATNNKGYGSVNLYHHPVGAHRVAYELLVGPIPEGLVLDHVVARGCTSRACVNPAHLEPVTNSENLRRTVFFNRANGRKTHCPEGHPYTPENTYRQGNGARECRECRRERSRAYRVRLKTPQTYPEAS